MSSRFFAAAATIACALSAVPSFAHEPTEAEKQKQAEEEQKASEEAKAEASRPPESVDIFVGGDKAHAAASQTTITGGELRARPRMRPADVLQAGGGLFAVQHAGGGKANQYFLRGFDADHGTDLRLMVDGVPINLPSHGHGQGFADMNFIIPELITSMDVYKGTYYPELGDFATAGAVDMHMADLLPESQASMSVGQYGILRGLGIVSKSIGDDWRFTIAGEAYAQNGPFENPEKFRKLNAYLRATHDIGPQSSVTMTWMSYTGRWNGNGQIPLRATDPDTCGAVGLCIDRFGTIDPTEGGTTQRHIAALRFQSRITSDTELDVTAYAQRYAFKLYSNFTFFNDDPIHGDEVEQEDQRWVLGMNAGARFLHRHFGPVQIESRAGVQIRHDSIDNGLFHDEARGRLDTRVDAHVAETGVGLYAEERVAFHKWLQLRAGVRVDRMDVMVDDHLTQSGATTINGSAGDMLASPKASLILAPLPQLQFYADFGRGFHSNDARGATQATDPATLLVAATGYEVGARVRPWQPLVVTAAAYRVDLDSELVWNGDTGGTSPSDATTRMGVELDSRLNYKGWLFADFDLTLNRAVYRANAGNAGSVALAPTRTITAGIAARAPFGTFGSLRLRHIGPRPANLDGSIEAEGFTIVDAQVGHRIGPVELAIDVQNLLNTKWREVQFETTSRLRNETQPVDEIHFCPGWPFTARGTLTAYF